MIQRYAFPIFPIMMVIVGGSLFAYIIMPFVPYILLIGLVVLVLRIFGPELWDEIRHMPAERFGYRSRR